MFNVSCIKLMRREITSGIDDCTFEDCLVEEGNKEETQDSLLMNRTKYLFQIFYYHVTKGRNKTPLHVMNAHAIYKRCRSRELITSVSRHSISISYKTVRELRKDLAKYTVLQSSECHVPLPNHFGKTCLTLAAMDNFGNADKNSLSGRIHAYDTTITLFQVQSDKYIQKPPKDSLHLTNVSNLRYARRIPSFTSRSSDRVFCSFQCYKKFHLTFWAAKARYTPTFLR